MRHIRPFRICLKLALPYLLVADTLPGAWAAGGKAWYVYDYEYNFQEAIILIVFIFLAFCFETAWHAVVHLAAKSYRYSLYNAEAVLAPVQKKDSDETHSPRLNKRSTRCTHSYGQNLPQPRAKRTSSVKHVQLYLELANRAGTEFMILGFLGFTIFCFNQAGGFAALVAIAPPCEGKCSWHVPETDTDWLHMAEVVHIKLFLGMLLYFALISRVCHGSVKQMSNWEEQRRRRINHARYNEMARSRRLSNVEVFEIDAELQKFMAFRSYFISTVSNWNEEKPNLFREVLFRVFPPELTGLSGKSSKEMKADFYTEMESGFDGHGFVFSAYLALNVERGVRDSIAVHSTTWLMVSVLFGIFAACSWGLHLRLSFFTPFMCGLAFVILIGMWLVVRRRQQNVMSYVGSNDVDVEGFHNGSSASKDFSGIVPEPDFDKDKTNIFNRFETQMMPLRALQILVFLISYNFARTVADVHDWQDSFEATLLYSMLYVLLFSLLMAVLPSQLVSFLAMLALPPYVDATNLEFFYAVIDEQMSNLPAKTSTPDVREDKSRRSTKRSVSEDAPLKRRFTLDAQRSATVATPGFHHSATVDEAYLSSVHATGMNCQVAVEAFLNKRSSSSSNFGVGDKAPLPPAFGAVRPPLEEPGMDSVVPLMDLPGGVSSSASASTLPYNHRSSTGVLTDLAPLPEYGESGEDARRMQQELSLHGQLLQRLDQRVARLERQQQQAQEVEEVEEVEPRGSIEHISEMEAT
eukprot:TRINITY_DN14197_c0_g1_i1.p1 TRINITY_DN14197_c0_g1~~TRINITY_DN14197_c0_g1_i1.p1  ORF type:complete len:750 (+),score=141.40 TRINITY_DN14197_c0_g1_i1:124-2373(+)